MPGDRITLTPARARYYRAKYAVAQHIAPAHIAEIGVRAGYSAFALLSAAPDAIYTGYDLDQGTYGGGHGCLDHARKLLAGFNATIRTQDSRTLDELPPGIDLLHIDGDHTAYGCMSDLNLAYRSGVCWVLVDDYDYIRSVRQSVDLWTARHRVPVVPIHEGHRGMALLGLRM